MHLQLCGWGRCNIYKKPDFTQRSHTVLQALESSLSILLFLVQCSLYVKMFKCSVCDKVFTVKSNMLRQEKSHEQIKFICDDCKQIFSSRDHLVNHAQKKHGMYFIKYYLNIKLVTFTYEYRILYILIN